MGSTLAWYIHHWWPKRKNRLIQSENVAKHSKCLFLLSEESLNFGGGLGLDLLSGPVVLGLGHSVSKIDILSPCLLGVGSTLGVPLGVVLENSSLGDVSLVVGFLLGGFVLAKSGVGGGGQARRDVGLVGDLTNLQL